MEAVARPAKARRPPEEALLDLHEFDAHGTSRAEFKDRWIEVEHGIPGEQVRALVFGKRRRSARIEEIVKPAPDRVEAPCPHFHQGCGGCQWQMLSAESQLERKLARARSALTEAGLAVSWRNPNVEMGSQWRYRATAGISLGHAAGFRRRGSQSIVALADCPICVPEIGRLAAELNRLISDGAIRNFFGEVGIEVRSVESDGGDGLHCCIVPSPASRHASIEAVMPLAKALAKLNFVTGIVYRHRQDAAELLFGEPYGWRSIEGRPFALSAATFFQTNLQLLPVLLRDLRREAGLTGRETVIDVYGGVGLLGLWLADEARRVIEIEIDPVGTDGAKQSRARQQIANVDFLTGTAEGLMAKIETAEIVIVDPPRSGLTPKVIEAIGRLKPNKILYVSCFAPSMARDAAALGEFGYRLGDVKAYDFYPQTYHLELFAALTRGSGE